MKKSTKAVSNPDMRAEYDFASMKGGVRGKYAERYRAGANLVLLEPEVAAAFPTADAVNKALRKVMRATKRQPPGKRAPAAGATQAMEPRR